MSDPAASPSDPLGDDIRQLADEIFREKVLRARGVSPAQKLRDGLQLFDWACRQTLNGIRNRYPHRSPEEHGRVLQQRLANARRMDETGLYFPLQDEE